LKKYWAVFKPDRYSNLDYYTLGDATYIMIQTNTPKSKICQDTKNILIENFDWLYKRICDKIFQITGKPAILHPNLTVPGFHIFYKPFIYNDDDVQGFHIDEGILAYDNESNMESSRSILIPIDMPSNGSYLLYKDEEENKKMYYKTKAMYHWDARLEHKAGGSTILSGECRITCQSHYYYNKQMQINLLYF
jgi:hypothetical protein